MIKKSLLGISASIALMGVGVLTSNNQHTVSASEMSQAKSNSSGRSGITNARVEIGGIEYLTNEPVNISSEISYAKTDGYRTNKNISFKIDRKIDGKTIFGNDRWEEIPYSSVNYSADSGYNIVLYKKLDKGGTFRIVAETRDGNTYTAYSDTYIKRY